MICAVLVIALIKLLLVTYHASINRKALLQSWDLARPVPFVYLHARCRCKVVTFD
jgi:hypothetical protein